MEPPAAASHPGAPTIRDVASAAGVSLSTVSLALNGKGKISESTRERVLRQASLLGYTANPIARRLRGQPSRIIGISLRALDVSGVYSPPGVDHYLRVFGAAATTALDAGYSAIVTSRTLSESEQAPPLWVDGFIVEDPLDDDPFVQRLVSAGVPLVTIGWLPGQTAAELSWVSTSDLAESYRILEHLKERGARRIALVSGSERTSWHIQGEEAYRRWAAEQGMSDCVVPVPEADGVSGGHTAAAALLESANRPDAILCHTARHAAGAARAARDAGLRIPDDLLIAACSDGEAARSFDPPITTIDLKPEDLGRRAVEILLNNLSTAIPVTHALIEGALLVRTSTRDGLRR